MAEVKAEITRLLILLLCQTLSLDLGITCGSYRLFYPTRCRHSVCTEEQINHHTEQSEMGFISFSWSLDASLFLHWLSNTEVGSVTVVVKVKVHESLSPKVRNYYFRFLCSI